MFKRLDHIGVGTADAERFLGDHGVTADFFIMLADVDAASYTPYVEAGAPAAGRATSLGVGAASAHALAAEIDNRLRSMNTEYDSKRGSGRLDALSLRRLQPGTGAEYRRRQVAAGQRDAQFKYLHVQYRHDCAFDFDAFSERD